MYHLRPYYGDTPVVPLEVLYHMVSYHQSTEEEPTNSAAVGEENSSQGSNHFPVGGGIDADITERLKALEIRLDKFIARSTSSGGAKSGNKGDAGKSKAEAGKASSSNSPSTSTNRAAGGKSALFDKHGLVDATDGSRAIWDELSGANDLELIIRDSCPFDKCWLGILSSVGARRGTKFSTTQPAGASKEVCVRVTVGQNEVQLRCPSKIRDLRGELEVWKGLGSVLGLYSTNRSEFELDEKWLLLAKRHYESHADQDSLARQIGAYLGANDFLSGARALGLPDLVLRAFYHNPSTGQPIPWGEMQVPNNVQLWAKRVDERLK